MDIRVVGNELIKTLGTTNMFLQLITIILLLNLIFYIVFNIIKLKRR